MMNNGLLLCRMPNKQSSIPLWISKILTNYFIILNNNLASFVQCPLKSKSSPCLPCVSVLEIFHEPVLKRLLLWFLCNKAKKQQVRESGKRSQPFNQTKPSFLFIAVNIMYYCTSLLQNVYEWSPSLDTIKIWDHIIISLLFFI